MLSWPIKAYSYDFLMGADAQATGGLGIVTSTGVNALHYNPAMLGTAKQPTASLDVGYLNLNYEYTYPGFDSVQVKICTPFVFTGFSLPVNQWLTVGSSLFPIPGGGSELEIAKIPSRQLSQEPGFIDVSTSNTSPLDYTTATGLSLSNRRWFSLGLSYIRSKAETETIVTDSLSGDEIFALKTKVISQKGLLGLKLKPTDFLHIGLTYQTLTLTNLNGAFLNEGGESFKAKAHKGRHFGIGAKVKIKAFEGWFEGLRRQHSENTGSVSPFTVSRPVTDESYDAQSFTTGLGLKFNKKQMLTGAFGWHPTTVGSGYMAEDANSVDEVPGIQFGDMDAISRTMLGLGYRHVLSGWLLKTSLSYQYGFREVESGSRAAGTYKLDVFSLTSAFTKQI